MELFWTTPPARIGSQELREDSIIVLGFPFDSTVTGVPGQRLGPSRIRESVLSMDAPGLEELLWDGGDIIVAPGNVQESLDRLRETLKELGDRKTCILGGEHTLSLAGAGHHARLHEDLWLLVLDAHADYKKEYQGQPISHATWLYRLHEEFPGLRERTVLVGARAMDEEEREAASGMNKTLEDIPKRARIYVSVDIDALDPSLCPGVGDPEPGGLSWSQLEEIIEKLEKKSVEVVGFDVAEVNPLVESVITPRVAARILERLARLSHTPRKP